MYQSENAFKSLALFFPKTFSFKLPKLFRIKFCKLACTSKRWRYYDLHITSKSFPSIHQIQIPIDLVAFV